MASVEEALTVGAHLVGIKESAKQIDQPPAFKVRNYEAVEI